MAKHNLLISVTFLALLSTFANTTLPVLQSEANNTHSTFHIIPTTPTMSNAQAPIRGHDRGRAFIRGGRGAPRGGRNAVNPPEPPRDGGSPITAHLSTLHDASPTTDDTIELFTQVKLTHHSSHSITVRQKHVENVCGGLNSQKNQYKLCFTHPPPTRSPSSGGICLISTITPPILNNTARTAQHSNT
jgi:hypothetical protein